MSGWRHPLAHLEDVRTYSLSVSGDGRGNGSSGGKTAVTYHGRGSVIGMSRPGSRLPGHDDVVLEAFAAEQLGIPPGPRAGMSAEQVGELFERVRRGVRAEAELELRTRGESP